MRRLEEDIDDIEIEVPQHVAANNNNTDNTNNKRQAIVDTYFTRPV